jgi:hypothetical protein
VRDSATAFPDGQQRQALTPVFLGHSHIFTDKYLLRPLVPFEVGYLPFIFEIKVLLYILYANAFCMICEYFFPS